MIGLVALVVFLVLLGAVLAMTETSISRMSRVRALALREEGRRNASTLVKIETEPARFLNSIYFAVMVVQNGSAILVAIIAEQRFGSLGITLLSIGFTILYFIIVEAMSKTFGILHSDRVALGLAPFVALLARVLSGPTRLLIAVANVLLPGKGLRQGPFVSVSEEDIRSMAEVGHEEGAIEREEKEMIHSIFEFGDTVVREVMVPRPDMVAIRDDTPLRETLDTMLKKGFSRMPVYHETMDNIGGLVYAKDVMRKLRANGSKRSLKVKDVIRQAVFVPENKKVAELLREMQASKTHMAIVVDEYGDVAGLVTLEDLLEEIVGEIADEYDREDPQVMRVDANSVRVAGKFLIDELADLLGVEMPETGSDTVGGLVIDMLGRLPKQGDEVRVDGLLFRVERVQGRRIAKVLVVRVPESEGVRAAGS